MGYWILFTGHMIDSEGRENPRFPAEKEVFVKNEISNRLDHIIDIGISDIKGVAGGASGGDILFHELCLEKGIPTEMYLALPVDEFKKKSVSFAGVEWDRRFDRLLENLEINILPEDIKENSQNVWESANLWMIKKALQDGGNNMTLLALWDGQGGDGDGGTEHMVSIAKEKGATIQIIDINKL